LPVQANLPVLQQQTQSSVGCTGDQSLERA
jgi:hypothetical protein